MKGPRGRLYSILLLPLLLAPVRRGGSTPARPSPFSAPPGAEGMPGSPEPGQPGPRLAPPVLIPIPEPGSPPSRPSPFSPSPNATRHPSTSSSAPGAHPTSAPSSAATTPTSRAPAPDGPPAKPPPPPPTALTAPDIAPIETGPAIPLPTVRPEGFPGGPARPPAPTGAVYRKVIGQVVDEVTAKPVGKVEVSIPELDLRSLADEEGWFLLHGIRARERAYEVLLTAPGYHTTFGELTLPESGPEPKPVLKIRPLGW